MKNKFSLIVLSAIVLIAFTAGCSSGAPVTLTTMDQGWDSQKFHNQVAKFIVENGFDGYILEEITGSAILMWQALLVGEIDLDIEEWTDNVVTYKDDIAEGRILELGTIVEDSAQGFYVPRYVIEGDPERGIEPMAPDLKTVADLVKYPHVFKDPDRPGKGRVFGAIPGWMVDDTMFQKYKYYGLDKDYNYFRSGSEVVLFAAIESAYNLGEGWVGYCWEPAWITGKYDMVLLEDAPYDLELYKIGACEIPKQALKNVSSSKFPERAPDLVDFFSKYRTGTQKVSEVLAYMEETKEDAEKAAIWYLKNNDSVLDEWLLPEQAAKVRAALALK
jgi:glycine betaine/proline transport system permease protein/glycine betaine/proline transport system substrate-binding protein